MTVYNQGKPKDAEFFGINLPFSRFLKLMRFIIFLPTNRYSNTRTSRAIISRLLANQYVGVRTSRSSKHAFSNYSFLPLHLEKMSSQKIRVSTSSNLPNFNSDCRC